MSAGFLGLNTALSGLFANQRSLGIVSHNIANANTEGYSRQVMNTKAYQPQVLPGGMGTLGVGVDVTAVKQIRDNYLDFKYRVENSVKSEWDARASVLTELEGIFNEPSDSSIAELMDQYYESLQSLQKNPENLTARTLVRQNTIALSEGTRRISTMLKDLQSDLNFQFQSAVGEVNSLADQIAKLNETIYKAELEGGIANDVRDQRNVLVDKLSELVNVDYYEDEQNRFYVLVGGQQLVAHYRSDTLQLVPREKKLNPDDGDEIMDVQWANGNKLNVTSGKLLGLRDVRDNITGDKKGIPYYVDKLNEFIDTFSSTFNEIHEGGYGLDGSTGNYMFTIKNMTTAEYKDYLINKGLNGLPATEITSSVMDGVSALPVDEQLDKINDNISKVLANNPDYKDKTVKLIDDKYYIVDRMKASDITIAKDLEDLNKFAAGTNLEDLPGDGTNILKLIETRHNVKLYEWGAPEDYIKSLVSNLGVDAAEANRVSTNQALLVNEYGTAKDSIMGVSLDEEMANMIKFQTAYNANARMVNVFDEMLDLVVNRLGTVGR
ncbi:flagellar hook-associated protein FlgK [Fusibacter bizertensis]|uniref:Flagellar hook-associated protein 1 n=1 Tax=Fusibacter bizertensis TaxID=1488331 RepID=A0ABT6NDS0_9FIRM|nr:flagellar hook-associated protein FlgK [Fusibacter bizertensis]MDH8678579.1 flagellar hook-associated protein FlgK [Fusibacter bizertensis]